MIYYNRNGKICYPIKTKDYRFSVCNYDRKQGYVDPKEMKNLLSKETIELYRIDMDKLIEVHSVDFCDKSVIVKFIISEADPTSPDGFRVGGREFRFNPSFIFYEAEDLPGERQYKYKHITNWDLNSLVRELNVESFNGWEPHGDVFISSDKEYCQIMKKKEM